MRDCTYKKKHISEGETERNDRKREERNGDGDDSNLSLNQRREALKERDK